MEKINEATINIIKDEITNLKAGNKPSRSGDLYACESDIADRVFSYDRWNNAEYKAISKEMQAIWQAQGQNQARVYYLETLLNAISKI